MEIDNDLNLSNLFFLQEGESHSISAENKKGMKGEGGKEASKLGVGRNALLVYLLTVGKKLYWQKLMAMV